MEIGQTTVLGGVDFNDDGGNTTMGTDDDEWNSSTMVEEGETESPTPSSTSGRVHGVVCEAFACGGNFDSRANGRDPCDRFRRGWGRLCTRPLPRGMKFSAPPLV